MTSNFGVHPARAMGTTMLILLAALIAAVASTFPSSGTLSTRIPKPDGAVRIDAAATPDVSPVAPRRANTTAGGDQIGALARALSDRYRVSAEGLRPLLIAAYTEGERHAVDPLLVIAVMAVESRFNPIAESAAGAMGLMQVIPRFHGDKFGESGGRSVLDPATNIRVGVQVLKETIARGGSLIAGLQLYNGSAGDSTAAYATKVLGEKRRLQDAARRSDRRAVS